MDNTNDSNNQHLNKRERRLLKRQEKQQERQVIREQGSNGKSHRVMLWILVIIGIIATVGIIVVLVKSVPSGSALVTPVSASDHTEGNKDAKNVLVEYADFQCPACAAYYPLLKKLNENFKDKYQFAYRYFPLSQIHKHALVAAYAAEAAGRQGKFWEMSDLLYTHQTDWADVEDAKAQSLFLQYAQSLKLNIDQFTKDENAQDVKDLVSKSYDEGVSASINSTPTFFFNGKMITPPQSYDEFVHLIDPTAPTSTPTSSVSGQPSPTPTATAPVFSMSFKPVMIVTTTPKPTTK